MRKYAVALALVLFLVSAPLAGTPKTESELTVVFNNSKSLVVKLKANTMKTIVDDPSYVDQMFLDSSELSLDTLIRISNGKEFSHNYLFSARNDYLLLEQYERNSELRLLKVVCSDYNTKATTAEINPNKAFKDILVSARTSNSKNEEICGYWVWHAATGLMNIKKDKFDLKSSPTSDPLPSGDYFFWTVKGDIESTPSITKIGPGAKEGTDGQLRQPIDVDVP